MKHFVQEFNRKNDDNYNKFYGVLSNKLQLTIHESFHNMIYLHHEGCVAHGVTRLVVRNSLVSSIAFPIKSNIKEVKAVLSLFYTIGESSREEALITGNGFLKEVC